jgi:heme exporter protein A
VNDLSLHVTEVTKRFGRNPVFDPISFSAFKGDIIAITGSNGTGKSTLLKIVCGVLTSSSGSCSWTNSEKLIEHSDLQKRIGFVAPYLELYSELTAIEHVQFVAELKGKSVSTDEAAGLLTGFGLEAKAARGDRSIGKFSSGMQQRVRFAMAFAAIPDVLFLDEPSSNLDDEGTEILFSKIKEHSASGGIVIIATNDDKEKQLAHFSVHLEPFKKA